MFRFIRQEAVRSCRMQWRSRILAIIQHRKYPGIMEPDGKSAAEERDQQHQISEGSPKDMSLPGRVFRLEDGLIKLTQDIGVIKGDINTIKWQVGVLLTAIVGAGGTLLGLFVKEKFFSKPGQPMQSTDSITTQQSAEVVALLKETTNALKGLKNTDTNKPVDEKLGREK